MNPDAASDATDKTRFWMDRNLGASRRATVFNDALSYGGYFQWGRQREGHECSSTTYAGPVASVNGAWNGKFVTSSTFPFNWTTVSPAGGVLWGNGVNNDTTQTFKGATDPCPAGYQVPNENEIVALSIVNRADAFTTLALSVGGFRDFDGSFKNVDVEGKYWSSTVSGAYARGWIFHNTRCQCEHLLSLLRPLGTLH